MRTTPAQLVKIGELEIRPGEGLVLAGGRAVTLSVREFDLLVALAHNAGRIVSREELYRLAWGGELRHGDRSCDVYVHKLRAKLERGPARAALHPYPRRLRLPPRARAAFTSFSHGGHDRVTGCVARDATVVPAMKSQRRND